MKPCDGSFKKNSRQPDAASMRYLVIGAGGTGGPLGAHLARAGKDVTFIARGAHLKAMRENGFHLMRPDGDILISPVRAETMETYTGVPDVVFVCVKGYSLPDVVPFLRRVSGGGTIVIPVLNLFGTGARLQAELPEPLVTDGCIYVAASIVRPGVVRMTSDLLRVVFGVRNEEEFRPELTKIAADLNGSGIRGILSDNIRRDALLKFAYVSPQGACGLYYGIPAGGMRQPGEQRNRYIALMEEIGRLGAAMGVPLPEDFQQRNLAILDALPPDMTTSLQKDVAAGRQSELEGLVFDVVRMGKAYGVPLPVYEEVAETLASRIRRVPN